MSKETKKLGRMNNETKKPDGKFIRRDRLRQLRNDINFQSLFHRLGWPWKRRDDGVLQFVCPLCSESQTSVNPRTNLARCFRCDRNWNPIDFTIEVTRMDFLETIDYIESTLAPPIDPDDRPF
jgi:hypothetical protein